MKITDGKITIHINKNHTYSCAVPCHLKDGYCKQFNAKVFIDRGFAYRCDKCKEWENSNQGG